MMLGMGTCLVAQWFEALECAIALLKEMIEAPRLVQQNGGR
jgi:hypothetical protein